MRLSSIPIGIWIRALHIICPGIQPLWVNMCHSMMTKGSRLRLVWKIVQPVLAWRRRYSTPSYQQGQVHRACSTQSSLICKAWRTRFAFFQLQHNAKLLHCSFAVWPFISVSRTNVLSNIFVFVAHQSNSHLPIISAPMSKSLPNAVLSQYQVHRFPVSKTIFQWNSDLGHVNYASIIALFKIDGSNISIKGSKAQFFYNVCTQAGMTCRYSRVPMPRSLRLPELIHMDIIGGGRTLDDGVDYPEP